VRTPERDWAFQPEKLETINEWRNLIDKQSKFVLGITGASAQQPQPQPQLQQG